MWLLDHKLIRIADIRLRITGAIKIRAIDELVAFALALDVGFEDFPESESLVGSCTCYCSAIWAQSKMENTAGMPSKLGNLLYFRVFPDAKLVINVAMR